MYVKVMAAVIACILMSGETHSTSATIPATENQSWFKKRKKKQNLKITLLNKILVFLKI